MKSIFRAVAGVVIAASATFAAAQTADTLTFEIPVVIPDGTPVYTVQGINGTSYNFDAVTAGGWALFQNPAVGEYSIPGGGNWQITGMPVVENGLEVGNYGVWSFSATNGSPFALQSLQGCCGPVWLELYPNDPSLGVITLGQPVDGDLGGIFGGGTGTYIVPGLYSGVALDVVAVHSYQQNFAIDNIQLISNVPEPSSYAMMIAGLGVLGFVARRRKAKAD